MEDQNRSIPPQQFLERQLVSYQDDEISLIELWQILIRRKYWIVACFMACLVLGTMYAVLKPPVFEARTLIRIGQVADVGLIENPDILASRIMAQFGKTIATGVTRDLPYLSKAEVQKTSKDLIELTVMGQTPDHAGDHLRKIRNDIIQSHRVIFEGFTQILKERTLTLQSQIKMLQKEIENAYEILPPLKQNDPVQASFIILENGKNTAELYKFEEQLSLLEEKLSPPLTAPTEMVGVIINPKTPSAPNKRLIVALSVVLGLFLGVILAFFVEFLSNARERK